MKTTDDQKKQLVQRNKRIVKEAIHLIDPTVSNKLDIYGILAKKYSLSMSSIMAIVGRSKKITSPKPKTGRIVRAKIPSLEKRNTAIINEYNAFRERNHEQKKNYVLSQISVRYSLSVAAIYYIIKEGKVQKQKPK